MQVIFEIGFLKNSETEFYQKSLESLGGHKLAGNKHMSRFFKTLASIIIFALYRIYVIH